MARIRTIKPDFWTDEKIVELSPLARLLFIGLWNFADDEGRMQYSVRKIKMQIFPAESTDLSGEFGEIRGKNLIDVYEVDSIEYLQIINFDKHQKIDKRTKSKFPEKQVHPESPRIPPTEGKGREWNGMEWSIHPRKDIYISNNISEKNSENFGESEYSFNPDEEMPL